MPCDGRCCSTFTMSTPLAQLESQPRHSEDGEYILSMIVPQTNAEAEALGAKALDRPHFGCALWDPETRLCRRYEQRPKMCSRFPYGRPCPWPGCDEVAESLD